jgi:hypothetical protein
VDWWGLTELFNSCENAVQFQNNNELLMQPVVTMKQWQDHTDEELLQTINNNAGHSAFHLGATHEMQRRQLEDVRSKLKKLEKPHWSVVPNFWLTAIAATLAIWFAYHADIREKQIVPSQSLSQKPRAKFSFRLCDKIVRLLENSFLSSGETVIILPSFL